MRILKSISQNLILLFFRNDLFIRKYIYKFAPKAHEKFLSTAVGGFWAATICHFKNTGRWPSISDIFFHAKGKIIRMPLDQDTAELVSRTSEKKPSDDILGHEK
jgi:hypothetical protein